MADQIEYGKRMISESMGQHLTKTLHTIQTSYGPNAEAYRRMHSQPAPQQHAPVPQRSAPSPKVNSLLNDAYKKQATKNRKAHTERLNHTAGKRPEYAPQSRR